MPRDKNTLPVARIDNRVKFDRKGVVQRVCDRLATGEPLAAICRSEGFPEPKTIREWMREDEEIEFSIADARARGFDHLAQECLDIADEEPEFAITDGGKRRDSGFVAWQKNRIETRLKLLAKWDPKRYGDMTTTKHEGGFTLNVVSGVPQVGDE